jgi:membrane protein implicated in regulation of membrane protease activity
VTEGFEVSLKFSILWGLFVLLLLVLFAPYVAGIFSDDALVQKDIAIYLRVVPIGYAAYGAMMIVNSTFNAIDHATRSTILSVLRSIVFAVPFAWVANMLDLGLYGIFAGLAVGSVLSVLIGIRWMGQFLNPERHHQLDQRSELEQEVRYLLSHTDAELASRMQMLVDVVLKLENMELHHVRDDAVGFYVGNRQLAHIHPSGHIDIPLPLEIGETLVSRGFLTHHRLHENNGWYSHELFNEADVQAAQWLLQLAHALYEIKLRGRESEITKAELASLELDEGAYDCIVKAAERWGVHAV